MIYLFIDMIWWHDTLINNSIINLKNTASLQDTASQHKIFGNEMPWLILIKYLTKI